MPHMRDKGMRLKPFYTKGVQPQKRRKLFYASTKHRKTPQAFLCHLYLRVPSEIPSNPITFKKLKYCPLLNNSDTPSGLSWFDVKDLRRKTI